MFGKEDFKKQNHYLAKLVEEQEFLIVAHRGQWHGNIIQNSIKAAILTEKFGAEIMELDLAKTKDGRFFLFHTGDEPFILGQDVEIEEGTYKDLAQMPLRNNIFEQTQSHLQLFEDFIKAVPENLIFQIDRIQTYLPEVLAYLDQFDESLKERFMLKCRISDKHLKHFNNYPYKFMCMPVISQASDLNLLAKYDNINYIGVEILAWDEDSSVYGPEFIQKIHDEYGLLVQINALRLNDHEPVYAGYDDDISLLDSPEKGWGVLIDHGADLIQTDWVLPLANYRLARKNRE